MIQVPGIATINSLEKKYCVLSPIMPFMPNIPEEMTDTVTTVTRRRG
jgi:hypothetical protein